MEKETYEDKCSHFSCSVCKATESQLTAAKAEIENIKKGAACYREGAVKGLEAYQEARTETKRLREALKEYGNHAWHCKTSFDTSCNPDKFSLDCDCGFIAALDGGKA